MMWGILGTRSTVQIPIINSVDIDFGISAGVLK